MDPQPRTLSRREAELVNLLEAERRPSVSLAEVRQLLGWSDATARNTLSRLARKGWLRRTARGQYETLLAETGGWSVPNPWAALGTWSQRYYVGLKSAAYEEGLTPERPGSVQACVPVGAKRPLAWAGVPVVLIPMAKFLTAGTELRKLHGFEVRIAKPEKVLVDGGHLPGRVGGIFGLARIMDRAADLVEWQKLVDLAKETPSGRTSLRRLAALLELEGRPVPGQLAEAATAQPGESWLYLGTRRTHEAHGPRLGRWQVVANVEPESLRAELGR
jgi:predicted transcriptional regulator of viral defense system